MKEKEGHTCIGSGSDKERRSEVRTRDRLAVLGCITRKGQVRGLPLNIQLSGGVRQAW